MNLGECGLQVKLLRNAVRYLEEVIDEWIVIRLETDCLCPK